jgi:hypothetical protein
MNRMNALSDVIAQIFADQVSENAFCPLFHSDGLCVEAEGAMANSMTAAITLFRTALPGWRWGRPLHGGIWVEPITDDPNPLHVYSGELGSESRELLVATLMALQTNELKPTDAEGGK